MVFDDEDQLVMHAFLPNNDRIYRKCYGPQVNRKREVTRTLCAGGDEPAYKTARQRPWLFYYSSKVLFHHWCLLVASILHGKVQVQWRPHGGLMEESNPRLALQLHIYLWSESMGLHDSEVHQSRLRLSFGHHRCVT